MPNLIIYDCDGTLIDSERLVAKVCMAEIHALGLTHWTMDHYFTSFVGMPGHVGWGKVAEELGQALPPGLNARVDARILEMIRRPFTLLGREISLSTSIGIAVYRDDGLDALTLLKHADTAMYHAKDSGRDNYRFYNPS